MKKILLAAAAIPALTMLPAAAMADGHQTMDHSQHSMSEHALMMVLADERRAEDSGRDGYRHPAETLAFFQVNPDMTVVEYGPGGGWYTRVLAPYLAENGQYAAIDADTEGRTFRDRAQEGSVKSWPERFPGIVSEWTGVPADKIIAFETDEAPEGVAGTVDRILIFRSLHGMLNGNRADSELRLMREMLTDDGMIGVVQHRAPADAAWSDSKGTRGYLKQDQVVELFAMHGFELVEASELNANPNDPADWEGGVWTLPPVLRYGNEDRARYEAIGESDRMTLLFKKAD